MEITLKSEIKNDEYTQYLYDNFDIKNNNEIVETIKCDMDDIHSFDWNIGLIYGGSGSGKTTILKSLGDVKNKLLDSSIPIISNFKEMSPKDATNLLIQMGLSSIPTLLKPYNVLSNGEKYRVDLAYSIYSTPTNSIILIDEYTSVVNRDVAKAMSFSLQRYIRNNNLKIVLASCHYDIFEWLKPDWIYSPQSERRIERCDYPRQRNTVEISVSRCEPKVWDIFKKHHYMSEDLNKAAKCFLFEHNNNPIAFVAILPSPSGYYKDGWRISRIVVMPDYQGFGIGSKIMEFLGGVFKSKHLRLFIKTIHPSIGEYMTNSDNWNPTSKNGLTRSASHRNGRLNQKIMTRKSYSFEYNGAEIQGFEDLLIPTPIIRLINKKANQYSLNF